MSLNYKNIQIDEELDKLLPPLSKEDYNILEQSLLNNGFKENFGRIKVWFPDGGDRDKNSVGYIVDGHNRYRICKKHNIDLPYWCYEFVFFDSKDQAIKWMYENQLARRNLSEMDKYEIVEKYSTFLDEMAKKNQSDGGKGLPNLTRVNTRKEKAKMAGTSDGNYYKLAQIKKSKNEEVIEQVRNKEISVDKGYQMIRNPVEKKKEAITPQQQIERLDNRMNEIDKEISSLRIERESLMRRRSGLFEALDIPCELKYEFLEEDSFLHSRECRFYIEIEGHKEIFVECGVYMDEIPDSVWLRKVPEKYKNDFIMLWKKAHQEDVLYRKKIDEENQKKYDKKYRDVFSKFFEGRMIMDKPDEEEKIILKKFYRVLATAFHPDSPTGDAEMMRCVNQLKEMWGI